MSDLPDSWIALPLGDAVINISINGKKIPQKEYLSEGGIPVIDQGQDYIGGYTDNKEMLVKCDLPVIIFGDHTRVVKFVNRLFAPGADGIKVLQPQSFYVPKLLEYFIQHITTHLTSHGYARHYQHLVKSEIPLPPYNEQHRIVAKIEELFSELDKGIENLKTAREQLKVYRQALLKHAFEGKLTAQWRAARAVNPAKAGVHADEKLDSRLRGNDEALEPAAALLARIQTEREQRYRQQLQQWQATGGSKPKAPKPLPPLTAEELAELPELPEGWGWVRFELLGEWSGGGTPSKAVPEYWESADIPWVSPKDMKSTFIHQTQDCITELGVMNSPAKLIPSGSLLFVVRSGILRRTLPLAVNKLVVTLNQDMQAITPYSVLPEYLLYYSMGAEYDIRQSCAKDGTTVESVDLLALKNYRVPICSAQEQELIVQEIESKFSEIDQLDLTLATSLQQSEALRQSILKKAFSGQLVAQDASDEPAAALLARIRAEKDAQSATSRKTGKGKA